MAFNISINYPRFIEIKGKDNLLCSFLTEMANLPPRSS